MIVGDIMSRDVRTADPAATVQEAAARMRSLDVGVLPVCLADNRVVGVITDRDIAVRVTAAAVDPVKTLVRDVMTQGAVACFEHVPLEEAIGLMRDERVRQVMVVDIEDRLVGMVSIEDVVHFADEALAARALIWICNPSDSSSHTVPA
jgi:CBS domain-containing protein